MAEKIAQLSKDTQALCTTPVYWNTSDTWSNANRSYYYRQGNLVTLFIRSGQCIPNGDKVLLTLPTGYRPSEELSAQMSNASYWGAPPAGFIARTNGEVMVHCDSAYCSGLITFYTTDAFPYSDL